ncbi:hypothetical protein [Roseibium sp.]|uniref:hypothetical protein n=1 Tax=Roseibium sp. TaxID=1936156 RepID=UPI003BACC866
MGVLRSLVDVFLGTKIREWSTELSSGRKLKLILKERDARRYVLIRFSSAGDYQYDHLEADEVALLARKLSEMSVDMHKTG